jgi:hypothetical protein
MRAIQKVTSGKLTKQTMRKKNTYILNLLLNIVTDRTEALVISGNKFMHTCVKKVCRLWAQPCFDTFHLLLIIDEALWSKPVHQVGKQLEVAQSEIRAAGRVFKQLQVEMLQQVSSGSSCMPMCIVMEERYTIRQHSTRFVLNVLVFCDTNVAVLTGCDFFNTGIQKLIPWYNECLTSGGDYVEK